MDHASYVLLAYSSFKYLSLEQLIQVGMNQTEDPNPIPSFDEQLLINLCQEAIIVLSNEDNVLEIEGDAFIVGDLHGSFHDLLRILNYIGSTTSKIVFLGDYIDRGSFSLECITLLLSLKISYPNKFFLLRGNHEFDAMCSKYGFKKEILNYHNPKKMEEVPKSKQANNIDVTDINIFNFEEEEEEVVSQEALCDNYFANHINMNCYKYTEELYNWFIKAFSYLPIAAIINQSTFCIHGGLSPLLDKVEKISKTIQRPIENIDDNQLLTDLLWGDPSSQSSNFYSDNPRGRGKLFNGVSVIKFLKNNNMKRIIRAHECVKEGICENFNEKCITVFSASSYDKDMGNKSGIIMLSANDDVGLEWITFDPIPRLKKCDAVYFKVRSFHEKKSSKPVFSHYNIKSIPSCSYLPDNYFEKNESKNQTINFNDIKQVNNQPIPRTKSIRTNASNFRSSMFANRISFITGAQSRKSLDFIFTSSSQAKFTGINNKSAKDDESINACTNQVRLPFLTAKTTI